MVYKINESSTFRLTYWNGEHECLSHMYRHYLCVFAVEHLQELQKSPYLYANKFMPGSDFGAISCWFEYLHNMTYLRRDLNRIDANVYLNLPQVRFNRERASLGAKFNISNFNCTFGAQ